MSDAILCYVREPWAYFTTQSLEKQWGDDWNDAPYEHNAGSPYTPSWVDEQRGECWEISKLAFEGGYYEPCALHLSSPYSVEQINAGGVPWVRLRPYSDNHVDIFAGTSLNEFIHLIQANGGTVYKKISA